MKYSAQTDKEFMHKAAPLKAILLVQLGTPDSPHPGPVKRYLNQFLSDPRVVEIPQLIWQPILKGIILNTRPKESAKKYQTIWTEQGSPLRTNTMAQADKLQALLPDYEVRMAMSYGVPSIESTLREWQSRRLNELTVIPLYPQYSGTTTASVFDSVTRELAKWRNIPHLKFVRNFHDNPLYIRAIADQIRSQWQANGQADRLVFSFHGVPERTLTLGDPYHCECLKTARLITKELDIDPEHTVTTFQSRFGRAKWIEPYTEPTVKKMAENGIRKLDVVCPGFVSDCLETLEEVQMEIADTFYKNGGESFNYITCLNDSSDLTQILKSLV
jgi:ferrochelatase